MLGLKTKRLVLVVYMIDSDQHPDSNWSPLTSLSQITVRFKGILKSASFPNSQIYGQFEKVRNGHRYENLKKDIDLRIGCRFEKLKKGHRSEVQMSVM